MSDGLPRYALYYAPEPDTDLWRFGSSIIGYDAVTGTDIDAPTFGVPTLGAITSVRWHELTAEPRRYGFHATLKAPFRLAEGVDEATLMCAVNRFASELLPVRLEGLAVTAIGPFIALAPRGHATAINALASAVVSHFEPFRAPLTDPERARRLKSPLTERQADYLDRFGYPYVHEDFQFHMTLTGPLHAQDRAAMLSHLEAAYAELPAVQSAYAINRICVFKQDAPDTRFRVIAGATLAHTMSA